MTTFFANLGSAYVEYLKASLNPYLILFSLFIVVIVIVLGIIVKRLK